jgi:predicted Ser/Thr protein kinase
MIARRGSQRQAWIVHSESIAPTRSNTLTEVRTMSTEKQKAEGMSTAERDRLADAEFAFPAERKEPISDAAHVRNAIARFDQVEGVTDEERDQAWQRIRAAASKYGVHISEEDWRDLFAPKKGNKE